MKAEAMQLGSEDRLDPPSNEAGVVSSTSKSSSSLFPPVVPVQHTSWNDRNARQLVGSPLMDSGTCLSSSKLPSSSSTQGTTPSSMSRLPTCQSTLSPLTLSKSSHPSPGDKDTKFTPQEILQDTAKPEQQPIPPSADASGLSLSSDSDELGPQTRASIRAWARATYPGPPRDTLSPVDSSVLVRYRCADARDHARSASSLAHNQSSETSSLDPAADSRSGPEDGPDGSENRESSSSSDSANVESGGSASHPSASPPPSPSTHPAREHPLPFPPHAQSSASDPPPPAIIPSYAHAHDQIERLDRRQHRHPHSHPQSHSHSHSHSTRRRHRDRDRRSRASPGQGPEPRLPAPPTHPPRPLQLIAGGPDVLEEISRMLVHSHSRGPLVRPTRAETPPSGPRENDVLDDICLMVHLSRM